MSGFRAVCDRRMSFLRRGLLGVSLLGIGAALWACSPSNSRSASNYPAAQTASPGTGVSKAQPAPSSGSPPLETQGMPTEANGNQQAESPQEVSPSQANGPEASVSETEQSVSEQEVSDRLSMIGLENPQALKAFLSQLREAALALQTNSQDSAARAALANRVAYPLTLYRVGEPYKTYQNATELLADFDQVFTAQVLATLAEANYSSLFVNYQGAMLGNGEVWLGAFDEGIEIFAVNPP